MYLYYICTRPVDRAIYASDDAVLMDSDSDPYSADCAKPSVHGSLLITCHYSISTLLALTSLFKTLEGRISLSLNDRSGGKA